MRERRVFGGGPRFPGGDSTSRPEKERPTPLTSLSVAASMQVKIFDRPVSEQSDPASGLMRTSSAMQRGGSTWLLEAMVSSGAGEQRGDRMMCGRPLGKLRSQRKRRLPEIGTWWPAVRKEQEVRSRLTVSEHRG